MADLAKASKRDAKKDNYGYPSYYGSHSSMIVEDLGDKVICADEHGKYETEKKNIDSGTADPYRFDFGYRKIKLTPTESE